MAYIYKIINDINNKVYIGQTSFPIEKRWKEHLTDYCRQGKEQRPLYSAMKKYGVEHFHISIVEETDNPNEREKYWIQYYNSYHFGYNATLGGEGTLMDFSLEEVELMISLYNKKTTIREIAKILGHDATTISKKLSSLGYKVENKRNLKFAVAQIKKQTNQVIAVYESTHDAARALGDERKNAHIRECCRGLRLSAYGYKWEFVENIAGEWNGNTISGS